MINPLAYVVAGSAYAKALIGRRNPIASADPMGLTRLAGWEKIPESESLERALRQGPEGSCHAVLYCYEGPHAGESFSVRDRQTSVGTSADCGIVLTPAPGTGGGTYQLIAQDTLELVAVAPLSFELNGRTEYRASLVDYDELLLFGNRFIVLQNQGVQS